MKSYFVILICLLLLMLAQFCGEMYPPDIDDEQPKALRLTPDILIKDELDINKKDIIDWKDFSYFREANVTIVFMFGEPFTPHKLSGTITLFNFKGEVLEKTQVYPGKREYPFMFLVNPAEHYFFKIEAKKGGSPYMVETKMQMLDPCLKCKPEETCCKPGNICCRPVETCVEGKCVEVTDECNPPCSSNKICRKGVCERPCEGGCSSGKVCNKALNKCVSASEKRCPSGTVKEGNQCISAEQKCKEPCPSGETCSPITGLCEVGGILSGTIVNYYPITKGTELIINVGRVNGVKNGSRGNITGVKKGSFIVVEVYPGRCKARTKATKDAIGKATKVTIHY